METYCIYETIYLDRLSKSYKIILTIDRKPNGPLSTRIKTIQNNPLSPFQVNDECIPNCLLAVLNENLEFVCLPQLPTLITYLTANNYKIDYNLTTLLTSKNININQNNSKILFYISYG
jgi:hypothetical protein